MGFELAAALNKTGSEVRYVLMLNELEGVLTLAYRVVSGAGEVLKEETIRIPYSALPQAFKDAVDARAKLIIATKETLK